MTTSTLPTLELMLATGTDPPIMWSKLRAPSGADDDVERTVLLDRIDRAAGSLIALVAPAGFGKTTVAAQFASRLRRPIVWVSVDSADRDAVRLWSHVIAGFREIGFAVDDAMSEVIDGHLDRALDLLVVAIEGEQHEPVLVLDDVHEVDGDESLTRLIARPPDGLSVVLTSRTGLSFPLTRLMAAGVALIVDEGDLAFAEAESRAVFERDVNAGLIDAAVVDDLLDATSGWPVGLRLAQLSLRRGGRESTDAVLSAFTSGLSPEVAAYLAGEVVDGLTEDIRGFMIVTSMLDVLTPDLCDAVLETDDALATLRRLASDRLFTSLVDAESSTFTYHRVLRDVLRARHAEYSADVRSEQHRRAADWYEERGDIGGTITHAVAAGEHDRALAVLGTRYIEIANAGQVDLMWRWVSLIGVERVLADPVLAPMPAWASLNRRRYDEIEPWLEAIELISGLDDVHRFDFTLHAGAIRSHRDRHLGALDTALEHAQHATALSKTGEELVIVPTVLTTLGVMQTLTGAPEATATIRAAIEMGEALGEESSLVQARSFLALTLIDADRSEAVRQVEAALAKVTDEQLERFHRPSAAWLVRSIVALDEGRVRDAEEFVDLALHHALVGVEPTLEVLAHATRARVMHLMGRPDDMRASLRSGDAALESLSGATDWIRSQLRAARAATRFAPPNAADLPPGVIELSEREYAVLRLVPNDLSRREIAEQLFVSENTVKTHLTSIRHKLGVPARGDIAERARVLGLLPDGSPERGDQP